jgi:hypothetical protein
MGRLAYTELRRCLALSHCYVVRCAQRLSSGYSFLWGSTTHLPARRASRRDLAHPLRTQIHHHSHRARDLDVPGAICEVVLVTITLLV